MKLTEEQIKKVKAHARSISEDGIAEMMFDGDCETADGCLVEPDGRCPHGFPSPLRFLGYI